MITREEYELLKKYRELGYKWIARDANERLYVYRETPMKSSAIWSGTTRIPEKYFTFIKWEDEKPTKIDDLIRDYESHQTLVGESVKVTIPQFVADWIEEHKKDYKTWDEYAKGDFVFRAINDLFRYGEGLAVYDFEINSRISSYTFQHPKDFIKAILDGYEIEQQFYSITLSNGSILIKDPEFNTFQLCKAPKEQIEGYEYKLTQSEIESVDPRLMQFAEEVE